jgi:hypothetical protein
MNYANKETWLCEAVPKLNGRPWFWIDDIQENCSGLPAERCICVNPLDDRELEGLKNFLQKRQECPLAKQLNYRLVGISKPLF